MSYFADQDIDTRTCGQADEDAWLDRRDDGLTVSRYTYSAQIDTTSIQYDRFSKDYAIYDNGRIVGYGRNYSDAEDKRTAYLADKRAEQTNAEIVEVTA